ncbi:MAG: DSD1 family PLP-dependent enzyme, partial [Pseudomonadota bacterium]
KTHKSADISLYQMAQGAVGVCCQKVSEAEALARGGVGDILVTNQVVHPAMIARAAALAGRIRLGVCVDDGANVAALAAACRAAGTRLDVLVEIDVGQARCGVAPGEEALALAQIVAREEGLRFAGLQAYHGSAQHYRQLEKRRFTVEQVVSQTRATAELLAGHGLPCETIGGAGTGTFALEGAGGVHNELQPGSYIFMDADYARIHGEGGQAGAPFRHALHLLTTIMSKTKPGQAVCDAGLKAHSVDSGLPVAVGEGLTYVGASDEHGVIADPGDRLAPGDRVRLIPGHIDPTCNLHDWFVGVRGGRVEALWPITARGCVF